MNRDMLPGRDIHTGNVGFPVLHRLDELYKLHLRGVKITGYICGIKFKKKSWTSEDILFTQKLFADCLVVLVFCIETK